MAIALMVSANTARFKFQLYHRSKTKTCVYWEREREMDAACHLTIRLSQIQTLPITEREAYERVAAQMRWMTYRHGLAAVELVYTIGARN
jgi:hypothetical protein